MGLFTLGLLRGASQQYVRTKEAEAAAEARQKELEEEREFRAKEAEKAFENQKFLAGRQQYFQERLAEKQEQWATARDEQNFNQQVILAEETQRIQQEAVDANKEKAIVDTFGYIALDGPSAGKFVGPDYAGEKRLPDATELGPELQRRVQKGIPTILPTILGTIPGFDNIIKSTRNSSVTSDPYSDGMYGASDEFNNGYLSLQTTDANGDPVEQTVRIPAVDPSKGDLKGRARANTKLVMRTITETPGFIEQMIAEYNRGEYGNFNMVRDAISLNAGDALRESMKIAKTEGGDTVINNPIDFYGLLTSVKGKANQRWFAENVLGPALSLSVDTIKTLMGDPAEISYTFDEVNNRLIRPNEENWKWATTIDPETNKVIIKKDIWKQVQDITKFNGLPSQVVLGLVKNHKNPLLALKDMAETRTTLEANVYRSGSTMQITQEGKDLINEKLEKNNFQTVQDEILYVRTLIKDNPASRPHSVSVSATGDIVPKYNNRKKLYNINGEDARQMANASQRAKVIAGRMLALREGNLGGVGLPALFRRLAGGGQNIAEALLYLGESYAMEPAVASRYAENAKELQKFAGIDKIDVTSIQGQKLFDLLGEQLAFALAAANQGGEGGRAISDRDVEAQRAVLGLQGILASDAGLETNLKYIQEQMSLSAAINEQYAKAIDSEDFLAVYIYDQSQGRSRTLDALLEGAPKKFEAVQDPSSITPETHPEMFVKLPDGRTVRKAK